MVEIRIRPARPAMERELILRPARGDTYNAGVMRFFARCARGLEWVASGEIAALGGDVIRQRHREVWYDAPAPGGRLLTARTVEDVYAFAGSIAGIGHTRSNLAALADGVRRLDVQGPIELKQTLGGAATARTFEVVASFLGRRNYTRFDIEDAIGPALEQGGGLAYVPQRGPTRQRVDLSWRAHVSDGEMVLGLRLAPRPLHKRPYKQHSRPGSLHPPTAAALALMAGIRPGGTLLDPFCGAGTIPIEAALLEPGLRVFASDADPEAVEAARANAALGGASIDITCADFAGRAAHGNGVDRVVTNPPWGGQVSRLQVSDAGEFWRRLRQQLSPGGRAVVLAEPETDRRGIADARLRVLLDEPISVFGRHPAVLLLADADSASTVVDRDGRYGDELAVSFAARTGRETTRDV